MGMIRAPARVCGRYWLVAVCIFAVLPAVAAGIAGADATTASEVGDLEDQVSTDGTVSVEEVVAVDDGEPANATVLLTDEEDPESTVLGVSDVEGIEEDLTVPVEGDPTGTVNATLVPANDSKEVGVEVGDPVAGDLGDGLTVLDAETGYVLSGKLGDERITSDETFLAGQNLVATDSERSWEAGEEFQLVTYHGDDEVGDPVDTVGLQSDGTLVFEDIPAGMYVIETPSRTYLDLADGLVAEDTTSLSSATFSVAEVTFAVEFDDLNTDTGAEELEITIAADREQYAIEVTAESLEGDELDQIFQEDFEVSDVEEDTIVLEDVTDRSADLNVSMLEPELYEFRFETRGTPATERVFLEVEEPTETDRRIDDASGGAGDMVGLTVEPGNTDTTALQVGDVEEIGYEAGIEVDASRSSGQEVEVAMNTHMAGNGSGVDSEEVVEPITDGVEVDLVYENAAAGEVDGPLAPATYDLQVGDGFDGQELEGVDDIAVLELTDSDEGTVSIYTVPAEDDLEELEDVATTADILGMDDITVTETNTIAQEDAILLGLEDVGASGLLDEDDLDNAGLSSAGISIALEEASSRPNVEQSVWNTSDEENTLAATVHNHDGYHGGMLVVELSQDGPGYEIDHGAYTLTVTVDDNGDRIVHETEIEIVERDLEWGKDTMEVGPDGVVTGETTLAPGTEIETQAEQSSTFVIEETAQVRSDGGNRIFEATLEFDGEDFGVGDVFELRAIDSTDDDRDDVLDVELVETQTDDESADAATTVTVDAPKELSVGESDTMVVTVENDGDDAVEPAYTIEFETPAPEMTTGVNRQAINLWIEGSGNHSESYALHGVEAGTLEWTVTVDEVTESGTAVIVEEADDDLESNSSNDDRDEADHNSDEEPVEATMASSEDGIPVFVASGALVAGSLAVLLGWYRRAGYL